MSEEELKQGYHQGFLDALEQLDRSLHSSTNLEEVLKNTLDLALDVFDCDRAYLLHPADPDAAFYRILMECTRPEYPGAGISKEPVPVDPGTKAAIELALKLGTAIALGTPEAPVPPVLKEMFGVLAQLGIIVKPRVGKPWILGLQQCSGERIWTDPELTLFTEFARRIGDGLGTLLLLREMQRNEEDLRITLDAIADGVIATSASGLITRMNPVAAKLTSVAQSQAVGQHIDSVVPFSSESSPFHEALQNSETIPYKEVRLEQAEEEELCVALSHAPIRDANDELVGTVAVLRDLSEAKRLEEQLIENEKVNAIGLMASGVAHDFNNQLTVIQGFAELIELKGNEEDLRSAKLISQAAANAARLTQQLLLLSRKSKLDVCAIDCHLGIEAIIRMLVRSVDKRVNIESSLRAESANIEAVPSQLENVLLNLGINACDAMPNGGMLVFETRLIDVNPKSSLLDSSELKPGTYLNISVTDTGEGIPQENLGRVFEPFFTTKQPGKGTGLGLATVRAFAEDVGGTVKLYTELGKGTTFNLFLPLCDATPAKKIPGDVPLPTGVGTVLIVDDEPAVRQFMSKSLASLGYQTVQTRTAREAVETFEKDVQNFALIILDVMLPDASGLDLIDSFRELNTDVPIVLISGFTEIHIKDVLSTGRAQGFLSKPFSIRNLAHIVAKTANPPSQ